MTRTSPTRDRKWYATHRQNHPLLPQQLQGEIRGGGCDARVKSVRVDQPGVRLSAQAGVTSVEQG
ncbi:hypothetical protein OIU92_00190 [Escherichia coli]|nr:hypothetical protein [Escherichia coli]